MRFIEEIKAKSWLPQPLEAWLFGLGLGFIGVSILATMAFVNQNQSRYYPNIYINGLAIGGMTKTEALQALTTQSPPIPEARVTITVEGITVSSSSAELGLNYNYEQPLEQGMLYGKTGSLSRQLRQILKLQQEPLQLQTPLEYDEVQLQVLVDQLQLLVEVPDLKPSALLKTTSDTSSLTINPGLGGRAVQTQETIIKLQAAAAASDVTLEAPVASTGAGLSPEQLQAAQERATKLVDKQLVFNHPDKSLKLTDQDLVRLLAFPSGINEEGLSQLLADWQIQVTREPQDAVFDFDPATLAVKKFIPHLNGLQLDIDKTKTQIVDFLNQLETSDTPLSQVSTVDLTLAVKKPHIMLSQLNDLGIDERIGVGDSEYDHSIPTRIHNVSLTSERMNNIIIKPGEEFSFNKALGDVSAATGFQPAYVIKNGQTVLGDGGGVCQVSTTLFRAALNAGLNITKRRPHSYRVSYYELNAKPGIDATVYSGDVDLRFVNDTGRHILIRSQADSKSLYMAVELYGTSDGRQAEILDHKTWGYQPAPPAVYIPDSTLAPGKLKQIDWAASGIKASFRYKVTAKDGSVLREQTFTSNYMPWSAKYLRGEAN